jgi:hypothetical protein
MSSPDNTNRLPWLTVYKGFDIVRDGCGLVSISSAGEIVAWATDQATAKRYIDERNYIWNPVRGAGSPG